MDGDWHSRADWSNYGERLGQVSPTLARAIPDFLVISPPKTGTSWLYEVLKRHPGIFLPAGKEMRYFDVNWRYHDINSYLRRFADGDGLVKGEITPPYCLLPRTAIAAIRRLNPAMKLIFLARDPVAQAWSLMKHNYFFSEDNFRGCTEPFETLTLSDYLTNFTGDYALSALDHLGTLQRWLEYFPIEQFWIGTLEEIADRPVDTLDSILGFLGVNRHRLAPDAPVHDVVFAGLSAHIDRPSKMVLRTLHRRRARRFVETLQQISGKDLRPYWRKTLDAEILSYPFALHAQDREWYLIDGQFHAVPEAAAVISGEFGFELEWLTRLAQSHRNASMVPSRFAASQARMVGDLRLKAVLDAEFHAGSIAHAWDGATRGSPDTSNVFALRQVAGALSAD